MKKPIEVESNLLGRVAQFSTNAEHCWKLFPETSGEIVAVFLDAERELKVMVRASSGTCAEMWVSHLLIGDAR